MFVDIDNPLMNSPPKPLIVDFWPSTRRLAPTNSITLHVIVAPLGASIPLVCAFTGSPRPSVTWYQPRVPDQDDLLQYLQVSAPYSSSSSSSSLAVPGMGPSSPHQLQPLIIGSSNQIYIPKLLKSGKLQCVGNNSMGQATQEFWLLPSGSLRLELIASNQRPLVGESVVLNCSLAFEGRYQSMGAILGINSVSTMQGPSSSGSGSGSASGSMLSLIGSLQWRRNGQTLTFDHHKVRKLSEHVIEIRAFTYNDNGAYECVASGESPIPAPQPLLKPNEWLSTAKRLVKVEGIAAF